MNPTSQKARGGVPGNGLAGISAWGWEGFCPGRFKGMV
jgi:hypothetical protein